MFIYIFGRIVDPYVMTKFGQSGMARNLIMQTQKTLKLFNAGKLPSNKINVACHGL